MKDFLNKYTLFQALGLILIASRGLSILILIGLFILVIATYINGLEDGMDIGLK